MINVLLKPQSNITSCNTPTMFNKSIEHGVSKVNAEGIQIDGGVNQSQITSGPSAKEVSTGDITITPIASPRIHSSQN